MNWKAIARSATGTSHEKQQLPCQDYGDYKIINDAIIGVVADGLVVLNIAILAHNWL